MARTGLVPKQIVAQRDDGTEYVTTVWVRPTDAAQMVKSGVNLSIVPSAQTSVVQEVGNRLGGELLSEQTLSTGVVQMRILHEGRGPVAVLISDSGQAAVLGDVPSIYNIYAEEDQYGDEAAWYNNRFGLATVQEVYDGTNHDPDDVNVMQLLINDRGIIGLETNMVPGHLTGWPVSVNQFAGMAIAQEDTGDWDYENTPNHPRSSEYEPDYVPELWEPAAMLEEYLETEEGQKFINGKPTLYTDERIQADVRYDMPPFLKA